MKTLFKKLISIVLVLTMVFSLSATAFAAEPNSYEELSLTEAEIQAGIERTLTN